MKMKVFINGLLTGLVLQTAIGPVFIFIANLALQKTVWDGLTAVTAVTLADYIYITLAILGAGALLEKKKIKSTLGFVSSIVLIVFGALMILKIFAGHSESVAFGANNSDITSSFISAFFLTISSPMTIVFWTGLFAAKALEKNYSRGELVIFGIGAGLATLLFMGTAVVLMSLFKATIPDYAMQVLNAAVGAFLILYGLFSLWKVGNKKHLL